MARPEINRSGEMEVFVRVVELGGFSSAARAGGMTPSAVSKLISRLEARLGARLLNRSTRKLQLTPEGAAFYERAVRILADLEDAERGVSSGEQAVGRIRLNTNASFGTHILAPLLPEFLARYPGVTLDIIHTDTVVNLLEAQADIAIRAGPLKSSSLVARKLGATRMMIVAAPAYIERFGMPESVAALEAHNRMRLSYTRSLDGWPLRREDGEVITMPAVGTVRISDGEALRHLVVAGAGLARLAAFTVREDIRAGRLVPVLEGQNPGDLEEVHAVWLGQGGRLPARIRALLDFLAARAKVG